MFISPLQPSDQEDKPIVETHSLYSRVTTSCYVDIAFGFEPPDKVLRRYGFNPADSAILLASPSFQTQVDKCRAELTSSGMMFRAKNAMLADTLMQAIYQQASNPNTPLPLKLEAYKTFAKFGNLEPAPAAANAKVGGGVSININFSGKNHAAVTIQTGEPSEAVEQDTGTTYDAEPQANNQIVTLTQQTFAELFPEATLDV